jgi:hypothetical protein
MEEALKKWPVNVPFQQPMPLTPGNSIITHVGGQVKTAASGHVRLDLRPRDQR